MFRNFIPFILAVIGLYIIFVNFINPLFEWQVNEITTDLSSSYEVSISPSPWKARIGDSLNDKSYVLQNISVSENGNTCLERDLNFIVKRSQRDEVLERLSLLPHLNDDTIDWMLGCLLVEITLSWWFAIWYAPRTAFPFKVLATVFYCFVTMLTIRVTAPRIVFFAFDGSVVCHGTIMFSAKLLKVYYSVPILVFTGILAELAALTMMVLQVVKVTTQRKESPPLAAG